MTPKDIKEKHQRKVEAIRGRPSLAHISGEAAVHLGEDLKCQVDFGDAALAVAGPGAAPTPGQLMRASIGSCLAQGLAHWGAVLDIPVDSVEIKMHFEVDLRGQLGMEDDVLPGWNKISYTVRIGSNAIRADIERLVEIAERTSPMLGNLRSEIIKERKLEIISAGSH